MNATPTCERCGSPNLTDGFFLDFGDYMSRRPLYWAAGQPESSFYGVKVPDRTIPVVAMHCENCGRIALHAKR